MSDSSLRRSGRTVLLASAGLVGATPAPPSMAQAAPFTADRLMSKGPPAALDRVAVAYARRGRAGVIDTPLNLEAR